MSRTRRWNSIVENPRKGGVSRWSSQRPLSDLSDAPFISARAPVHSLAIFTFWSMLDFRFCSQFSSVSQSVSQSVSEIPTFAAAGRRLGRALARANSSQACACWQYVHVRLVNAHFR